MSNRCCRAPSNQNALSCVSAGRGRSGRALLLFRLRRRFRGFAAAGSAGSPGPGLELEDPEPHRRDELALVGPVLDARRDEVADTEAGRLLVGDRLDDRRRRQVIAEMEIPVVLLLAVGRDHRREPGVVEQCHELVACVPAARGTGAHAAHDPGLEHHRRRHDLAVHRLLRSLWLRIDGVLVADGLDPVADHRLVHRVGAVLGLPGRFALELLEPGGERGLVGVHRRCHPSLLPPGGGHLARRAMPRPALAMISRCTSLTPPPKVLICAARPARSTSPCRTAPGEPAGR